MINPYFNTMRQSSEQNLSHDLVEEIIQMTGIDVYYIKVESISDPDFDRLFGENRFEKLRDTFVIEMYPRNFEQPYDGGDLYSKLGLTSNIRIIFEAAYRRFESVVGGRPREGDYIFLPVLTERSMAVIFKIMHVDVDDVEWNPQGTILKYTISCELSSFAHQDIETGIGAIDFSIPNGYNDTDLSGDVNADNNILQELGDMLINFDEEHPFGRP